MAKKLSTVSLGGIPRANLLPPEIVERRALRAKIGVIVRLIVLTVVVLAGIYAALIFWSTTTQASLMAAQTQSQDLLTQQGAFADAKQANESISQITEALTATTSSEVMWADLYGAVTNSLPAGSRVTVANFTGRAPFDGTFVPSSPLSPAKVAIITVTVSLAAPGDAATFIQSLKANEFVADATLVDLDGASGQYLANFRVDFDASALTQRFAGEATN